MQEFDLKAHEKNLVDSYEIYEDRDGDGFWLVYPNGEPVNFHTLACCYSSIIRHAAREISKVTGLPLCDRF